MDSRLLFRDLLLVLFLMLVKNTGDGGPAPETDIGVNAPKAFGLAFVFLVPDCSKKAKILVFGRAPVFFTPVDMIVLASLKTSRQTLGLLTVGNVEQGDWSYTGQVPVIGLYRTIGGGLVGVRDMRFRKKPLHLFSDASESSIVLVGGQTCCGFIRTAFKSICDAWSTSKA